ncbi:MAG TPA: hypothetical protein VEI97_17950, partial [bacterium]|nr:hypothetical protein [bacterium]
TVLILPNQGSVVRVNVPAAQGRGREIFQCAPQTVGRLMAGLESQAAGSTKWIDLLAASTPGVAIAYRRGSLWMAMTFPERVKTVKHTLPTRAEGDGTPRDVNFHLPPTAWILQFSLPQELLSGAWLFATPTRVTSVTDTTSAQVFPFGNAHDGSGAICWGNVATGHLTAQDPVAIDNLFFATGFNDHLFHAGSLRKPNGEPFGSVRDYVTWQRRNTATAPVLVAGGSPWARILQRTVGGRTGEE